MTALPALAEEQLPDGVYIGLPDAIYFAQNRLGSSDLIRLYQKKRGWWWSSRLNPDRKETQTDAMNYGSALHALMLEGLVAYQTRFAVEPDPKAYKRVLYKIDDYKSALRGEGVVLEKTSGFKSQDWLDACAIHLPRDVVAWENVIADFDKSITTFAADGTVLSKRRTVSAVENRALLVMHQAAVEADGPEGDQMRDLLGSNLEVPALAELSFFWTDAFGVRRRARFDKPVPMFTLDLKSLGNWTGRPLEHGIGDHILRGGLDIQVGDQHVARILMHRQIKAEGEACIHGGTQEERAWLMAIAERNLPFEWVWLFYQKPDNAAGHAPIIFPVWENWKGKYHLSGHAKSLLAIQTYLDGMARFGPDKPWTMILPVHYTEEGYDPGITHPHYGFEECLVVDQKVLDR
jgi:hypothetical protein